MSCDFNSAGLAAISGSGNRLPIIAHFSILSSKELLFLSKHVIRNDREHQHKRHNGNFAGNNVVKN